MIISAFVLFVKMYIAWKILRFICGCMFFEGINISRSHSRSRIRSDESLYTDNFYWQDQDAQRKEEYIPFFETFQNSDPYER